MSIYTALNLIYFVNHNDKPTVETTLNVNILLLLDLKMGLLLKWVRSFPAFQYLTSFLHEFLVSIIRTGPIPRHVAFIMDGNRRYARENNLKLHEGHYKGFETAVNVKFL